MHWFLYTYIVFIDLFIERSILSFQIVSIFHLHDNLLGNWNILLKANLCHWKFLVYSYYEEIILHFAHICIFIIFQHCDGTDKWNHSLWPCINTMTIVPGMGISIIKIWQLWGCLIFIMEFKFFYNVKTPCYWDRTEVLLIHYHGCDYLMTQWTNASEAMVLTQGMWRRCVRHCEL